jgi:hypothetical protein
MNEEASHIQKIQTNEQGGLSSGHGHQLFMELLEKEINLDLVGEETSLFDVENCATGNNDQKKFELYLATKRMTWPDFVFDGTLCAPKF